MGIILRAILQKGMISLWPTLHKTRLDRPRKVPTRPRRDPIPRRIPRPVPAPQPEKPVRPAPAPSPRPAEPQKPEKPTKPAPSPKPEPRRDPEPAPAQPAPKEMPEEEPVPVGHNNSTPPSTLPAGRQASLSPPKWGRGVNLTSVRYKGFSSLWTGSNESLHPLPSGERTEVRGINRLPYQF